MAGHKLDCGLAKRDKLARSQELIFVINYLMTMKGKYLKVGDPFCRHANNTILRFCDTYVFIKIQKHRVINLKVNSY